MAVVVTDNCRDCKFTECVTVCPVACFHQDDHMVYVDPELCIDCRACLTACPVMAIYDIYDLPDDKKEWIDINADRSRELRSITERQTPLPGAEDRRRALGFSQFSS
jgi:ferredoxin